MTTPAKQTSAQFAPLGTVSAPADWNIPSNIVLSPSVVFAHFDGTSAAGSFVPTLQILSDSGHVVAEIPQDVTVAAGASCEATWAPFLRTQATAQSLSLTITDVGLLAETFPIWFAGSSSIIDNATGELLTQIFPYGFKAGTTITGVFQGQWGNVPVGSTGRLTFGVCDATGKVLARTGSLGATFLNTFNRLFKAPFTSPLTLTQDTTLYGWSHGFTGNWNGHPTFACSLHSNTFLQQIPPNDWHTVLGAFPPAGFNSSFGTAAPTVGSTITLNPADATGSVIDLYLGLY